MKSCANCNFGKCSVFNEPCRSCEDRNKWKGVDICDGCIHEKVCMDGMANKCTSRLTEKDIIKPKLEKIKAEIVLIQSKYKYDSETEYYKVGRCEAHEEDLEIIDNHIKELKGEKQ